MSPQLLVGSSVIARVPASTANHGPGFDSIGLALGVWDTCRASIVDRPGVAVTVSGEGSGRVPLDDTHLVYRTMVTAWHEQGVDVPAGVELVCDNAVPHGRGLGSSATAIVTGIVAAQGLAVASGIGDGIDLDAVNDLASRLEGHPDNASASVYGGLTISWSDDPGVPGTTRTVRPRLHPDIRAVAFVPDSELSTAKARSVLPPHVRLADAASNSARAALLVHALTVDPSYLVPATREWLHQEPRRASYAASMQLVDRLRGAGHAAVVSGAGPSVVVLTTGGSVADVVAAVPPGWRVLQPEIPVVGAHLVS